MAGAILNSSRLLPLIAATATLAGCFGGRSPHDPTKLVTRSSFAGIQLTDSKTTVEATYGHGHRAPGHHQVGVFHYAAGFTVGYNPSSQPLHGVVFVYTTSRRFRTASGVGVGSTLAKVENLGHIDCAPTTTTQTECETIAHGPGLVFELVDGRVTRLGLVLRTN